MARFLVTGGAGFIGSHLVGKLIAQGHAVRVLDNLSTGLETNLSRSADFVFGDIRDPSQVRAALQDVAGCFHLAAVSSVAACTEDWAGTHAVNANGAINVFNAALSANEKSIPVVYASSSAVYGDNPACPLRESSFGPPLSAYGVDKFACELQAAAAGRAYGLVSLGLRFFNVYGPRQDPNSPYAGVISVFADRLLRGEGVVYHGDGGQTRDFLFVEDACAAMSAAMYRCMKADKGDFAVVNVCTGRETSVRDLAHTLGGLLGVEVRAEHLAARIGDIRRSVGDAKLLQAMLDCTCGTSLEDGLKRTLDWLRSRA